MSETIELFTHTEYRAQSTPLRFPELLDSRSERIRPCGKRSCFPATLVSASEREVSLRWGTSCHFLQGSASCSASRTMRPGRGSCAFCVSSWGDRGHMRISLRHLQKVIRYGKVYLEATHCHSSMPLVGSTWLYASRMAEQLYRYKASASEVVTKRDGRIKGDFKPHLTATPC